MTIPNFFKIQSQRNLKKRKTLLKILHLKKSTRLKLLMKISILAIQLKTISPRLSVKRGSNFRLRPTRKRKQVPRIKLVPQCQRTNNF